MVVAPFRVTVPPSPAVMDLMEKFPSFRTSAADLMD
jgi:hypothetical protein